MKRFLLCYVLAFGALFSSKAMESISSLERSMVDTSLIPFYHGVASGDPLPDKVIIWTRVTPDVDGAVNGTWRVALDTNFTSIVQSGTFTADSSRDYCVKIDVSGLQPNTWYFYNFTALGRNSQTGRTKTAPVGGVDQLRFAFTSCSHYPNGYFNAYSRIRDRNDIDAILHLGDYIYEYGTGAGAVRTDQKPSYEIIRLADYRQRYSTHRLDPDCRRMHQQYPFISIWDDHETANNSYKDGAENHTPATEGPWSARKSAGEEANDEWIPRRLPESGNINKIWRKISYGNLADLFLLDTRLYARTQQGGNVNDTSKHIIGNEQLQWLKTEMMNSTAKWKIIAQQVMMGNLTPFGITVNDDQWDGYTADRKKLYDIILNNNIQNVVVLTGDIHTAWAMDLPYNTATYNATTGAGSVGVEFVCTSVTSSSSPVPLDPLYPLVSAILPHIKYVDLYKKGYGVLDLTADKAQGNFYGLKTITTRDTNQTFESAWYTLPGTRWLKKATNASVKNIPNIYFAPETPIQNITTGIKNYAKDIVMLSAYPNPFVDKITLQFNISTSSAVDVFVYDITGKFVQQQSLGFLTKGLYDKQIELGGLAAGAYKLVLKNNSAIIERTIEKF
ncbi:MAG TPA: alkaline phosphatase D family protein [Chitinophagales bacterium]|nr:alkaline phosphatase D family protein [Chitinophagales bacterium]